MSTFGPLSVSMSSAASASESNEPQFCVSFCDMDDTAVYNHTKTIKNAHLLLPIKLFLSKATNQLLRILTNRNSVEEENNPDIYKMNQYLADLESFGISIPLENVIFAGNHEVSGHMVAEWRELDTALEIVQKHIQSLRLTEAGQELARLLPAPPKDSRTEGEGPLAKLVAAKFHGKNHHINRFLIEHHRQDYYDFSKFKCAQDALTVVMVDDLESIAVTTQALGRQRFIGIKAPEGGKLPERVPDYYKDDYLLLWAEKIGLSHYAQSLLMSPQDHTEDDQMMQIAGLLFAWQAFPKQIGMDHFCPFAKSLNQTQLGQIANMLQYIKMHHHEHKDAHFNSVADLADFFQMGADDKFLDEYPAQFERLQLEKMRQSAALSSRSISPLPEDVPATDKPKKGFGSFIKTFSSRSSSSLARRESDIQAKEAGLKEQAQLDQLAQEERALKDRLFNLTQSAHRHIAHKARKVREVLYEAPVSGDNASTSASSSGGSIRASSSSQEFPGIDRAQSPQPLTPLRSISKDSGRPSVRTDSPVQGGPSDDNLMRRISNSKSNTKK